MVLIFPWDRRLFCAGLSNKGQRNALYTGSRNDYGECRGIAADLYPAPSKPQEKVLLLPKANRCATHAVEYLHGRGIDYELIDFCISTGQLYESYPYHNVVFVGQDRNGKPRYANLRGIGSDFIGDANGSDKHYSFGIPAVLESDTLHLFESAVDLLSYGTMQKLDGKDWRHEKLLSLAGVYKPKARIEESSLPVALVQYLADYPHIRKMVLRLDNDFAGQIAADTIKTLLTKRYAVTVDIQPPTQGKDYNDSLCMRLRSRLPKRVYDPAGISCTLMSEGGGFAGRTGMYFIDLCKGNPKLTENARCIKARYDSGIGNRSADNSGVLCMGADCPDRTEETALIQLKRSEPKIREQDYTKCLIAGYSKIGVSNRGESSGVFYGCRAVLTPHRENKRQNGRRFKECGEPAFCQKTQDKHRVYLSASDSCEHALKIKNATPSLLLSPQSLTTLRGPHIRKRSAEMKIGRQSPLVLCLFGILPVVWLGC